LLYTETALLSGFFLKKKPPLTELVRTYELENRSSGFGPREQSNFTLLRELLTKQSHDFQIARQGGARPAAAAVEM
jgi:hypothetical protein